MLVGGFSNVSKPNKPFPVSRLSAKLTDKQIWEWHQCSNLSLCSVSQNVFCMSKLTTVTGLLLCIIAKNIVLPLFHVTVCNTAYYVMFFYVFRWILRHILKNWHVSHLSVFKLETLNFSLLFVWIEHKDVDSSVLEALVFLVLLTESAWLFSIVYSLNAKLSSVECNQSYLLTLSKKPNNRSPLHLELLVRHQ